MMTDAEIERYARQIVLPEVGPRGQARLLGSTVAVSGATELGARIRDLLGRAGVRVADAPDGADAVVWTRGPGAPTAVPTLAAHAEGTRATLAVRPDGACAACEPSPRGADAARTNVVAGALAACATHALAALAATETLLVLLDGGRPARRHRLDLEAGVFRAEALDAPVCPRHRRVT